MRLVATMVLAILVLSGLGGCSDDASVEEETFDVEGKVTAYGECADVVAQYPEVSGGLTVSILDDESTVVASGELDSANFGYHMGRDACRYQFAVSNVPVNGSDEYTVSVGGHDLLFTQTEAEADYIVLSLDE